MLDARLGVIVAALALFSLHSGPALAKNSLASLVANGSYAPNESGVTQAVETGKFRFVTVLGRASVDAYLGVQCFFVSEPATEVAGSGLGGVSGILADLYIMELGVVYQRTDEVEIVRPAKRTPVLGPYFQCAVSCAASVDCTDVNLDAFLSTR